MAPADDAAIRTFLEQTRTIAMIGASNNPGRPSHGVMAFLQSRGYQVLPVNPMVGGMQSSANVSMAVSPMCLLRSNWWISSVVPTRPERLLTRQFRAEPTPASG